MADILLETVPKRVVELCQTWRQFVLFRFQSLDTLMATRGPPPEGHHLHGKLKNAHLYVDKEPTSITYTQLADALRSIDKEVGKSLEGVSDKKLYKRVWDWCHDEARVYSAIKVLKCTRQEWEISSLCVDPRNL